MVVQAIPTILEIIIMVEDITIGGMEVITAVEEGRVVVRELGNNSQDQLVSSTHA